MDWVLQLLNDCNLSTTQLTGRMIFTGKSSTERFGPTVQGFINTLLYLTHEEQIYYSGRKWKSTTGHLYGISVVDGLKDPNVKVKFISI